MLIKVWKGPRVVVMRMSRSVPQAAELWNPSLCLHGGQASHGLFPIYDWLQQEYYAGPFLGNVGLPDR